jgi:hypothetical protein
MAEPKGTRKAAGKKPKVAWTKAFTPWGVPCSKMLVDGRTQACRDLFGAPVPMTQSDKPAARED